METLNDFTIEELKDLLLYLAPGYVASFKNEGLIAYRKLYNVIRSIVKSKVSESDYAMIIEHVINTTKRVTNMTYEELCEMNKTNFEDMQAAAINL